MQYLFISLFCSFVMYNNLCYSEYTLAANRTSNCDSQRLLMPGNCEFSCCCAPIVKLLRQASAIRNIVAFLFSSASNHGITSAALLLIGMTTRFPSCQSKNHEYADSLWYRNDLVTEGASLLFACWIWWDYSDNYDVNAKLSICKN